MYGSVEMSEPKARLAASRAGILASEAVEVIAEPGSQLAKFPVVD